MGRSGGYNSESYRRQYTAAEPEWFTEGPASQSDTIELRGFDTGHTRPTGEDGGLHDESEFDGPKGSASERHENGNVRPVGSSKNKQTLSDGTRDVGGSAVIDEHNQNGE